jgi:cell wall-associated NlpC family hydrolase
MQLPNDAYQAYRADVLAKYPEESCGLVIGGNYYSCTNVHEEPKGAFRIARTEQIALELQHGAIQAIMHSHPYDISKSSDFIKGQYNPAWASIADQRAFMDGDVEWGIVSTDGEGVSDIIWLTHEPKSLEHRQFEWFTSDCFALVRDWYHQNTEIRLPNFTREWEFWKKGINTIEDGWKTIPFARKLPTEKAQVGDMPVFALGNKEVINHVGVIVADNQLLHIFPNKGYFAHTTRWDVWRHKARYVVRYTND